jgi:DNA repair exonuclease SbcCD ATPase subunit/3',5'-cyclic AMP phosphodiesterase CpdA
MKIAHVSDIHIRNLKYHLEYRRVFEDFYRQLDKVKPDLIVNTGDTAHTKTQISPEFVQMTSEFLSKCAERAPMINILGNHDLNLMNPDRQDALSPIIDNLANPRVVLLKKSGGYHLPRLLGDKPETIVSPNVYLWNFGIADTENWPKPPYTSDLINIGLFHGTLRNCITDSEFRMTNVEHDVTIFDGLDYVLMGDIHKRQMFKQGKIWYPGSMIQQNFGEDPDKGFLLWDIRGRDDFDISFHELKGNRKFYTIPLNDDITIPEREIDADSRIRLVPPRPLTLVEQKITEKIAKKRWNPHDIIILGATNIGQQLTAADGQDTKLENLRLPEVQERLIRGFLADRKLPEPIVQKILEVNKKYQISVDQREDVARKMGWDNLFNYGEGNVIDFAQIKGLTGIFAPNASGKSSMIDIITEGAWDATTKGISKNIHLVNDNKDRAAIVMEVLVDRERYQIERVIERIKYGQRKLKEEKEWGKTSLNFVRFDKDGGVESLVGELRPETERNIRRRLGTFDDFNLTSLTAQWNQLDLIACKEAERKRILYKFLDLDVFEEKGKLAREESKEWIRKLADLEEGSYESALMELNDRIEVNKALICKEEQEVERLRAEITAADVAIEVLLTKKIPIENGIDVTAERRNLAHLDEEIARLNVIGEEKAKKLEAAQNRLDVLEEQIDGFDKNYHVKKIEEKNGVKKTLVEVERKAGLLQNQLRSYQEKVGTLQKVPCGDQFPTCRFLVNAFEAKKNIPQLESELSELAATGASLNERLKELSQFEEALQGYLDLEENHYAATQKRNMLNLETENLRLTVGNTERQREQARARIEKYEQNQKDIEQNRYLDDEIRNQKFVKSEATKAVDARRKVILDLTKKLGSDQSVVEKINKELEALKETRDVVTAYEHYLHAMGKDGIALQILTQKLPLINEEINKILSQSAEFGVYIEHDPEEQSVRLFLQYGQYKSRLLELGSGAEKFLASLAIRAALLNMSSLPKTNMFIIDEGFGKLDPQHLEAVQRMFDYLKSVFDHVIVISHTDVMKDMVDNMIEITADEEGYAHVEVGA